MEAKNLIARIAALLVAGSASAQTVPASATAAARNSQDVQQLSPFTVSTDRDTGFAAATSLAGGRLAIDLKDTPVAYSVITSEFIEALNIVDLSEAASWSTNAVPYVNPMGSGFGGREQFAEDPGSYDVRGAGNGRRQRNFFTYGGPMDSYSVERFDFGRGPNAILFGNGSLGGVSSTMTKQARFDTPFTTITQGIGSWDYFRTTVDVNRPLGDRLAVRFAAVWADADGWRERQFSETQAAFLTATFKLGRNTSIRLEGEYGDKASNSTFSNISDRFSRWDGVTTFAGPLTTLPSNASALGITRRPASYIVHDPFSGVNAIMNYGFDPITLSGSLPQNATLLHAINLPSPEVRFAQAIAGSTFRIPDESFSMASDSPTLEQRFRDVQLTIDHRLGDIFLQAAADFNSTSQDGFNGDIRFSGITYIDINSRLPNGAVNPHFLEPYGDTRFRTNFTTRDGKGYRIAAGSTFDAGKWGNYTWNVMGGHTETLDKNTGAYNRSIAQGDDHRRWALINGGSLVSVRRYWSEPSRPMPALTPIRFIDPINGVDREVTPIDALEIERADAVSRQIARYTYGIAAINAKYWRDRVVVLGAVRADDFYSHTRQQQHWGDYSPTSWDGVTGIFRPDGPADYATLTYQPKDASGKVLGPAIPADTRPRNGFGDRLPQYANDRFKSDYTAPAIEAREVTMSAGAVFHVTPWLSPYVNYAQTFNPPPPVQRIDTSFLPATVAEGYDFGLRFALLNRRLNLNLLYYRNEEINNNFGPNITGQVNALLNANPIGDDTPAGSNRRGLENVPGGSDLRDREADGFEFEVIANVTKGWRLMLNVGLPKVYEANSYQDSKKYIDGNAATFRLIAQDAGVIIDANNRATVDESIPVDQRSLDVFTARDAYNTIFSLRQNFVDRRRVVQDQPNGNFFSDYTFQSGKLRGLRVGAGVQYRGRQIIGFRGGDSIVNPANPTRAMDDPSVDAYSPAYTPESYHTVIATLGYTWRLERNREIQFNLKINNVLDDRGPIYAASPVMRPSAGNPTSPARETVANIFVLKEPISFLLTTTLKF